MTAAPNLVPCPSCGAHPRLYVSLYEEHDGEVQCPCGFTSGNHPTGKDATDRWNTRAAASPLAALAMREAAASRVEAGWAWFTSDFNVGHAARSIRALPLPDPAAILTAALALPEVRALVEAAMALQAEWDAFGGPEKWVPDAEMSEGGYFSPSSRMLDSRVMAGLREALRGIGEEKP